MTWDEREERYEYARSDMASVWGEEWDLLSGEDQIRLVADYIDAYHCDGCEPLEYRRCIGVGNLASYAACLAAGEGA